MNKVHTPFGCPFPGPPFTSLLSSFSKSLWIVTVLNIVWDRDKLLRSDDEDDIGQGAAYNSTEFAPGDIRRVAEVPRSKYPRLRDNVVFPTPVFRTYCNYHMRNEVSKVP